MQMYDNQTIKVTMFPKDENILMGHWLSSPMVKCLPHSAAGQELEPCHPQEPKKKNTLMAHFSK